MGVWKSWFPGGNFLIWGAPALLNIYLGGAKKASTLAALARKINVDVAGMVCQIAEANALAEATQPDPFGKVQELVNPVARGPFYAVNLSLDNRFAPAQIMTLGGLKVDEATGGVVRADGSVVDGLYAVGRAAVGICSNGYISGLSLADTVFSGRRAARSVAMRHADMLPTVVSPSV
jgi:3-oxo-5alpha-steroid 4-dehydrogenase